MVHYIGRYGTARVARLVLVSAVPPLMLRTDDNPAGLPLEIFDALRAGEAANRSQLYRDLADGPFFGHNRRGDVAQGFRDAFWLQSLACGHRAAYECIAAFSATDFRPDLAKVDVPTLVIHGDDDQIVPVRGRRAGAPSTLVEGARLIDYARALPRPPRHRAGPAARRPARLHQLLRGSDTMESTTPDTVVLVHGLWMTPRSWEHWVDPLRGPRPHGADPGLPRLRGRGRGAARRPDRRSRTPTSPQTIDHLVSVVTSVEKPPIIMGHSFGGALTQMLLARGLGAAGVAIDSAPDRGGPGQPGLPDQEPVPGAQQPGEASPGGRASRPSSSTTPSPTPSTRRPRRPPTTATPSPRPGDGSGTTA